MEAFSEDAILAEMAAMLVSRYGEDLSDLRAKMVGMSGARVEMTFCLDGHIPSDGPNTVRRSTFVMTPLGDGNLQVESTLAIDTDDDDDGLSLACDCDDCRRSAA